MGGLIIFLAVIATLVVFDLLAQRYGADSRPEIDDRRGLTGGMAF